MTDDINPAKDDLKTPLHVAAEKGHLKICELISSKIDDKHPRDSDNQMPVHLAADNGHFKICKMFIRTLEDKNPAGQYDWTLLHGAAFNGHLKICQMIMETIKGVSNLLVFSIYIIQIIQTIGHSYVSSEMILMPSKDGLISESVSFWLKSPKIGAKSLP